MILYILDLYSQIKKKGDIKNEKPQRTYITVFIIKAKR